MLRSSQSSNPSQDPPPVESRIKPDKSDFEEKERQRVAQEARAERRQKKQVCSDEKNHFCVTGSLFVTQGRKSFKSVAG